MAGGDKDKKKEGKGPLKPAAKVTARRTSVSEITVTSTANASVTESPAKKVTKQRPTLQDCPCAQSNRDCYQIKCFSCSQYWHADCVNIRSKSLPEKCVLELQKSWTCPWCYKCPHPRPPSHRGQKNDELLMTTTISDAVTKNISDTMSALIEDKVARSLESAKLHELIQSQTNSLNSLTNELTQLRSHRQHATPVPVAVPPPAALPARPSTVISHSLAPYLDLHNNFVSESHAEELLASLSSLEYHLENGHSVKAFGAPYRYPGAKAPEAVEFTDQLRSLVDSLNEKYCSGESDPKINQCLINRYTDSETYLPEHSDNEPDIAPGSKIFCVSLGSSCTITFRDRYNHREESPLECHDRSLYIMSRYSQDFFTHRIDKGNTDTDNCVRYSLTFRSVDWRHRNSTILIGDSNKKHLFFGNDKGTFGPATPGKLADAYEVEQIDPLICTSYANVVVLCGINSIRKNEVNTRDKVKDVYNLFKSKIEQIQLLNKRARIFVCAVLPTKIRDYNRKASYFNYLLENDLIRSSYGVTLVGNPEFEKFVSPQTGFLCDSFSFPGDSLHLTRSAASILARVIKHAIFARKKKMVNGMRYSAVASSGVAPS